MDPEEELAKLEMLDAQESQQEVPMEQPQLSAAEIELAELERLDQLDDISSLESAAEGLVQGVTVGFGDEIEGAVKAGWRSMTGDERPYSELYEEERDLARKDIALAKEANPNAFLTGEIGGGIGSIALTGGTTAGFRGAAFLGGLTGLGFSNKTGQELVKDVAIGTALGIGGEAVFKGIGAFWRKAVSKTPKPTIAAMEQLALSTKDSAVRLEASIIRTSYKAGKENLEQAISSREFYEQAAKEIDTIASSTIDDIKLYRKALASETDEILARETVKNVSIVEELAVAREAGKTLNSGDKKAWKKVSDDILDPLENGNYLIRGKEIDISNVSPKEMQELKREIYEQVRKRRGDGVESIYTDSRHVGKMADDFSNALLEKFNSTPGMKEINKKYVASYKAQEMAPKNRVETSSLMDVGGKSVGAEKNMSFIEAVNNMGPEFANNYKNNYEGIINMYNTSYAARQFNLGISTLFQGRAAASFTSDVGLGPAGYLLALGQGGVVQAANYTGKAMKNFKFPRNISSMLKAPDMSVKKLMDINRGLGIALNDAIVNRDVDTMKQIMTTAIEQHPEVSAEMEQGIGFEGQLTGPAEQEMVKNQILSNPELSVRQKMSMSNQVNNMQIPQQEKEVQSPFMKVYRNKSRSGNGAKKEDY